MNIISIESKKYKNTNFKLAIVESIRPKDEFLHFVKANGLGKAINLTEQVYTDGQIHIISETPRDKFVAVCFKLLKANWILKKENNSVELYVVDGYTGYIHIQDNYLREVVSNCYEHCIERIKNKREYAKKINEIARNLNLPFNVVLAFKGDEESIKQFISSLTKRLNSNRLSNMSILRKLNSNSYESKCKALKKLNILFPNKAKPVEDISKYALDCLRSKRILPFGEH